jgi:hypothetical protein
MAKRRKRTNANVPAKGRLRDMADQLWSIAIRDDWNNKCAVCGNRKCEAHHLIPRQHEATRYNMSNGIALCSHCHQFDPNISPHQNAAGWLRWLVISHAERYDWLMAAAETGLARSFNGTKNAQHYIGIILDLKQYVSDSEFERVCGIRFTEYLTTIQD